MNPWTNNKIKNKVRVLYYSHQTFGSLGNSEKLVHLKCKLIFLSKFMGIVPSSQNVVSFLEIKSVSKNELNFPCSKNTGCHPKKWQTSSQLNEKIIRSLNIFWYCPQEGNQFLISALSLFVKLALHGRSILNHQLKYC